jgi:hypothetical protein
MVETKRLGRLVKCPKCKIDVNPFVQETIPSSDKSFGLPSRDVVICPRDSCKNLWYTLHIEGADHLHG